MCAPACRHNREPNNKRDKNVANKARADLNTRRLAINHSNSQFARRADRNTTDRKFRAGQRAHEAAIALQDLHAKVLCIGNEQPLIHVVKGHGVGTIELPFAATRRPNLPQNRNVSAFRATNINTVRVSVDHESIAAGCKRDCGWSFESWAFACKRPPLIAEQLDDFAIRRPNIVANDWVARNAEAHTMQHREAKANQQLRNSAGGCSGEHDIVEHDFHERKRKLAQRVGKHIAQSCGD